MAYQFLIKLHIIFFHFSSENNIINLDLKYFLKSYGRRFFYLKKGELTDHKKIFPKKLLRPKKVMNGLLITIR